MQLIRNLIKVSWASFQHHKSSKTSKSYKEPTHFKNKGDCLGIYFWHSPWCSTNGSVMNRTLCKGQEQFSKNTPGTVNKTLLLSVRLLQSTVVLNTFKVKSTTGFFFITLSYSAINPYKCCLLSRNVNEYSSTWLSVNHTHHRLIFFVTYSLLS